jgi:HPt (histidine-containing phosphotransfer) domain-containing protein
MLDPQALLTLQDLVGGSRDDVDELIREFLNEAAQLVPQVAEAARTDDVGGLRRVTHTLKSNARDLGATAFADLCAEVERILRAGGTTPEVQETVSSLLAMWPFVHAALEAELAGPGAAS